MMTFGNGDKKLHPGHGSVIQINYLNFIRSYGQDDNDLNFIYTILCHVLVNVCSKYKDRRGLCPR